MNKLNLPDVTLICADCLHAERAIAVLEHCQSVCNFGAVAFFTSLPCVYPHRIEIPHFDGLNDYSAFMLKKLGSYVTTSHIQVVQYDGWILNTDLWNPEWLNYDYVAPPFIQSTTLEDAAIGSGGFSLRSKALTDAVAKLLPPWDGQHSYDNSAGNNWGHEDGVISHRLRPALTDMGFRYITPKEAIKYAFGGNPYFFEERTFGFHGFWPKVSNQLTTPFTREQLRLYGTE